MLRLSQLALYREATVPTLKESLEEDLEAAKGYIDTLRSSLEDSSPASDHATTSISSDVQLVRDSSTHRSR